MEEDTPDDAVVEVVEVELTKMGPALEVAMCLLGIRHL